MSRTKNEMRPYALRITEEGNRHTVAQVGAGEAKKEEQSHGRTHDIRDRG